MKCPKCQTDNPDDSKYCKECAAPLTTVKDISLTVTLKAPVVGFSIGTVIVDRYKIIQKIGQGGMGTVYKAEDTRLDRIVALKFLSTDLTRDHEARQRFEQEAKAAAALNHPHICTIYEVDEADGRTFISMEYIGGQTLKEKLASGSLGIDEAVDIATQVAQGLGKAHDKGIIHRDIKPANVMTNDDDQVKIMDFGLAKLSWGVDLTKSSTLMGTVAYMSPEQARGEKVDQRSDIWSLGCLLYEMLTGERPFLKSQEHALIYAILNEMPTPISSIRPEVPNHIIQVAERALTKNLNERFQNIEELIQEIGLSRPTIRPKVKKSIVVLPFENLSPDPEQEYFCDGMTEEIIADLSQVHDLLVISRSSAMTFRGTNKTIPEIARAVNVAYVLEGSVRKAGKSLRITAQLIDAANDTHLWAEKFAGTLDEIFDIQEKVSHSIVSALKLKLTPEEEKKIASSPIPNVYAYECFLKARHELWKWTKDGLDNAVIHLKKGMELAGENAVLLAGMGYVYYQYSNTGVKTDEITIQTAEDYTKRALEIDPESPNAHVVLALLLGWRGKPREAVAHLKRALAVEPNNFDALVWLPCMSAFLGKTEAVMPFVERLLKVEPLHPLTHFTRGMVCIMAGKFDAALDVLREGREAHPHDHLLGWIYAQACAYCRQLDEGYSVIEGLVHEAPDDLLAKVGYSLALALKQRASDALSYLKGPKIEGWARNDFGVSFYVSECYALLKHKAEALAWLENAVNLGFMNYPFLNEYNPLLENIRGEERFRELMERVKHEWRTFEV